MLKLAIIGAGISGLTSALHLDTSFKIDIFEKSRGTGGRMSTKRELPFIFDHGAQYFTVRSDEFNKFLKPLHEKKVIKPWSYKFARIKTNGVIEKTVVKNSDNHFVGVPNMNSVVKYLSKDFTVFLNTRVKDIKRVNNSWQIFCTNNKKYSGYNWVIFTTPPEQVYCSIPENITFYKLLKEIKMKCCCSLLLGFNNAINFDFDVAEIENNDIKWISVNNSKPDRDSALSIVINSSFDWAEKNINRPKEEIIENLLSLSNNLLKMNLNKNCLEILHKWRFVAACKHPKNDYFIDLKNNIGICGDWFVNSKVEGGFLSAKKLSDKIISLLS